MIRNMLVGVIVIGILASTAWAGIFMRFQDDFDDSSLVSAVSEQEPVKKFNEEINSFQKTLWPCKEKEIEKFLGKPVARPEKTYAMPVAEARAVLMSGIRYSEKKMNKNHIAFYPIDDFAGLDVWYGMDGESPEFAILYFKVDKTFPKLTATNIDQRLSWDRQRFDKLVKYVEKRKSEAGFGTATISKGSFQSSFPRVGGGFGLGALIGRLAMAAVGAFGVILLGALLRYLPRARRWQTSYRLAAAHALVVLVFMGMAPLYIQAIWGSPYGDVYPPYLLVPGIHITYPADLVFSGPVFHWLLGHMEAFPASILCVIVGPGLVGMAAGGLQWWGVGKVWDRLVGCEPAESDTAPNPAGI
jgi:hypothetical protein